MLTRVTKEKTEDIQITNVKNQMGYRYGLSRHQKDNKGTLWDDYSHTYLTI